MSKENNQNTDQLLLRVIELEAEIKILKQKRKYGLVWEDKPEEVVDECNTKYPILIQDKKRSIKDKQGNKPTNILIEGDNYHALQVLNYTHQSKIDVIYIDPPYNTGKKDFIYNDNYVDKEDSFRHSKWLSFMSKRLHLAKELLKDTGVIFISIDDNEQAQLKLLCDSVFGENNFVSIITVQRSKNGLGSKDGYSTCADYILCYKKDPTKFSFYGVAPSYKYLAKFNKEDIFGKYKVEGLFRKKGAGQKRSDSPGCFYPIYKMKDRSVRLEYSEGSLEILPKLPDGQDGRWVWSKDFAKDKLHRLICGKDKTVYIKDYLTNDIRIKPKNIFTNDDYLTEVATEQISEIFGSKIFDTPKPVVLIKDIFENSTKKSSVVLDFMAGSGTTGHAVMELNAEDNNKKAGTGNRQFILVTNNGDEKSEHKICEEVTYERLKRVMNGYTNKKGEQVEGLGGNLEYLKCDFVEKTRHTDNMKMRIMRACSEMLCLKEGTFTLEKEVKDGDILMYRIYSGYRKKSDNPNQNNSKNTNKNKKEDIKEEYEIVNDVNMTRHSMGVYYDLDDSYLDDMRSNLKNMNGTKSAYIFSLSNETDLIDNYRKWKGVDIQEVPQKILEIYEQIHKTNTKKR